MKNKSFANLLYSTVGVVAMAVVLVAVYAILAQGKQRLDLTQEKAYTLSPGTKNILKNLDAPVKIRFYYTQGDNTSQQAMFLRSYARQVEDLLTEYKQVGKGKIILEKYDPEPDSDAEDSAHLDGVEGQMMPNGERFYLGLAISYGMDQREALPFLDPSRERLLEYDLSRAITRVVKPEKPIIGI